MINLSGYDIWHDNLAEYINKQGYRLDSWWCVMYEKCLKSALLLNIFGFLKDREMHFGVYVASQLIDD